MSILVGGGGNQRGRHLAVTPRGRGWGSKILRDLGAGTHAGFDEADGDRGLARGRFFENSQLQTTCRGQKQ